MALTFRDANVADAPAIAAVIQAAWPDDTVDSRRIASLIHGAADRATGLALDGARVVGFVDGFLTLSAAGVRRWEVDLLAVETAYRGQGVARRLIAASVTQGQARGAALARGLIHVGNAASERAFAAAGFVPVPEERRLVVCDRAADSTEAADPSAYILPVRTFNYSGVWLEASQTPAAFQGARAARDAHGLDLAGAVIAPADAATAEACGYALVGAYRWWVREIGLAASAK